MDFCKHEFHLNSYDANGVTRRNNLEQVEKQTGRTPEELLGPPLPDLVSHLWSAFIVLTSRRPVGMNGVSAIPFQEIEAWERKTGYYLEPWEIDILMLVDAEYVKEVNSRD